MTKRDAPFTVGDWYHCYNSGIEKRAAYGDSRDYQRFLELLYLANDESPLRRDDLGNRPFGEILHLPRGKPLVSIGAFCLMPTHFHLLVNEVTVGGLTAFMRKIGTAYALYFNSRYERMGNLFLKPFRSRHIDASRSLQCAVSYIHCSPAELYEPEWRTRHVVDPQFLGERIAAYPYSSMSPFTDVQAPTRAILGTEAYSIGLTTPIKKILQEALSYCADSDIP